MKRFISLEQRVNLHDGYQRTFRIKQQQLMLVQVDGIPIIFEPICPHAGWSLAYARMHQGKIRCPKHDFCFDLISGQVVSPPGIGCDPLRQYQVAYQGDQIGVWLD